MEPSALLIGLCLKDYENPKRDIDDSSDRKHVACRGYESRVAIGNHSRILSAENCGAARQATYKNSQDEGQHVGEFQEAEFMVTVIILQVLSTD